MVCGGMWWKRDSGDSEKLLEELSALKRRVSSLEMEWVDVQDRLKRRLGAIAATYRRMQDSEETLTTEVGPVLSESDRLTLGRLPPAQRAVQEQIILRRKMGTANGR